MMASLSKANETLIRELRVLLDKTSPLETVVIDDACKDAKIGPSKLYQLMAEGEIASERNGRSRIINLRSLIAYRIRRVELAGSVDLPKGGSGRPKKKVTA
jgi:hypothetical protein